jgi:tetratricopeptide (TPR) repeat protein
MDLAIYLKEFWKRSRFCRLNWRAADTGLIPQVDLRIGIGCGEVALDHDVWSGSETLEGIRISEAKRIEGQADAASDTLIMVKLDIMEACIQAGKKVEFGARIRLQGTGVPDVVETAVYPVKTYGEWEAIQKKIVPSPRTYFERLSRALALHLSGDLEGAIKQYGRLLKERPDDPDVLANRGAILFLLRRYEEALADFNRSLQLRPDDPDTLSLRGIALYNFKRYDEALADYNRSLELRPDHPDILSLRGAALGKLERWEKALVDFNRSLELRPDDPETLNNRGITLYHLKCHDEALADFNRSLEVQPENAAAVYNRACLFSLTNRYQGALADLRQAIAGDAKYRPMAREDEDLEGLRNDPEWGPKFWELVGTEDQA